jgi:hypothetical protein
MQRLLIDIYVETVRIVGQEMLHLRHHGLRLNSPDFSCTHDTGQHRIFAERVVTACKRDIAIDIDERLEHHIDA